MMTDDDLKELLRRHTAPEADAAARERALFQARLALSPGDSIEDEEAGAGSHGLFQACAAGLAAAALVLILVFVSGRESSSDPVAAARELLRQFETTFPANLDAVIERGDEVALALADTPRRSNGQRLMLTITDSETPLRILTYSGQRVCVDLAGQRLCFEMLITDAGEVIVAGDNFIWTANHPVEVAGHTLSAEPLAQL